MQFYVQFSRLRQQFLDVGMNVSGIKWLHSWTSIYKPFAQSSHLLMVSWKTYKHFLHHGMQCILNVQQSTDMALAAALTLAVSITLAGYGKLSNSALFLL